jgi:hypothetical protein
MVQRDPDDWAAASFSKFVPGCTIAIMWVCCCMHPLRQCCSPALKRDLFPFTSPADVRSRGIYKKNSGVFRWRLGNKQTLRECVKFCVLLLFSWRNKEKARMAIHIVDVFHFSQIPSPSELISAHLSEVKNRRHWARKECMCWGDNPPASQTNCRHPKVCEEPSKYIRDLAKERYVLM